MTRIALDSNILVYLAGIARSEDDAAKVERVRSVVSRLAEACTLIAPVQALGELFVVARRAGIEPGEARDVLLDFAATFGLPASEARTAAAAADLVVDHKLQFWDAVILSAAVDAGCALLLSEDMQDGFVARGLTVANPLAVKLHPKLAALLST